MERRDFLRQLLTGSAGAAAALTFDPERLLWVPGAKTFFLPSETEFHHLITPEWVTREVLQMFKNNLKMANLFDREYADQFHATLGRES